MLRHYASLEELLRAVYPAYPWDHNSFVATQMPRGHWTSSENLQQALTRAEEQIGITQVLPPSLHHLHQ